MAAKTTKNALPTRHTNPTLTSEALAMIEQLNGQLRLAIGGHLVTLDAIANELNQYEHDLAAL